MPAEVLAKQAGRSSAGMVLTNSVSILFVFCDGKF